MRTMGAPPLGITWCGVLGGIRIMSPLTTLWLAACDRRGAQIGRVHALFIDELAAGENVACALKHDHQLGVFFVESRRSIPRSIFELSAIGSEEQDRLGGHRGVALAVFLRLVDETHNVLVAHECGRWRRG